MRSRMSREVPEWSGGKDLYMGSLILVAGKVSHFIGIVPGVPKGVRGSTKGVHQPRGATWAVRGAPWPIWAKGKGQTSPLRAGSLPLSAHRALRDRWPHPVDPRDPSGGPGTIPVTPKLVR